MRETRTSGSVGGRGAATAPAHPAARTDIAVSFSMVLELSEISGRWIAAHAKPASGLNEAKEDLR
jgi:hypothetical protein